ncbi:MAG: hypothetical protein ACRDZY_10800 [Acidimicrobiales bacterium]
MRHAQPCDASITASPAVSHELVAVPDGMHEIPRVLICELVSGHAGPHAALGQHGGSPTDGWASRWVRWSDPVIVLAGPCPAEVTAAQGFVDPVDPTRSCLLADGHPGPHGCGDMWWD